MSIIQAIQKRKSWRTYASENVDRSVKSDLEAFIQQPTVGPFGNVARFQLVDVSDEPLLQSMKLGTYGVIKGARLFIVGAVRNKNYALEDYGFCMEKIVLHATALGLGTCWLGVTFGSGFARSIKLVHDELIPAISPVGYAQEKRRLTDNVMRYFAGARNRKPGTDLFFQGDLNTPLTNDEAGPYATALEMVRLAPSASNKQPWRILKIPGQSTFHFFLKRSPGYDNPQNPVQLQKIDLGIALCHFQLTCQELNLPGQFEPFYLPPDADGLEYTTSWSATR